MRTKLDPSDEFFIPDVSEFDWSKGEVGRRVRKPGEKTEIFVDGAVAYQLRLIPSNKVLARFATTLEAWPVIINSVECGRSPRTLALDAITADGTTISVSAGPRLVRWARHNNGDLVAHRQRTPRTTARRVAEA